MALFEGFSAGYYVGHLYIESTDGEHALMEQTQHEAANEEYAGIIWRAISAFAGLLLMVWMVLTAQEKIARYGGSAGVGSATFVLNLVGVEIPIPLGR